YPCFAMGGSFDFSLHCTNELRAMETLAENLDWMRERIQAAARRSGRQPEAIRLVAATKTVEVDPIRAAIALGVREIGENYVQEAAAKQPGLADLSIIRHFIGHLQRNKA